MASGPGGAMLCHGDTPHHGAGMTPTDDLDGGVAPLPAAEVERWERFGRRLLLGSVVVMVATVALVALGLAMAPRDDSTLGAMKALVFRCH